MLQAANSVDFTCRPDPVVSYTGFISQDTLQRITKVAIPFITFYRPAAQFLTLGMSSVQVISITYQTIQNGLEKKLVLAQNLVRLCVVVSVSAISVLMPAYVSLATHMYSVAEGVGLALVHGWRGESRQCLESLAYAAGNGIHFASIYYGGAYFLALSYAAHAVRYLYEAISDYQEGHYVELIAHTLLAGISGYQMKPFLEQIIEEKYSRQMTQDDWDHFLELAEKNGVKNGIIEGPTASLEDRKRGVPRPSGSDSLSVSQGENGEHVTKKEWDRYIALAEKKAGLHEPHVEIEYTTPTSPKWGDTDNITRLTRQDVENIHKSAGSYTYSPSSPKANLGEYLKDKGLSKRIYGLRLSYMGDPVLSNMIVEDITFVDCYLPGEVCWSKFNNVVFHRCHFNQGRFLESRFEGCLFLTSNFVSTLWCRCEIVDSHWIDCDLQNIYVMNSQLFNTSFSKSILNGSAFLWSKFSQSYLKTCEAVDVFVQEKAFLLENTVLEKIERPIIGLGVDFQYRGEYGGYVQKILEALGARVILYPYNGEYILDKVNLDAEVNELMEHSDVREAKNIPRAIFDKASPNGELAKLKKIASDLYGVVHGMIIPGGGNVNPKYYSSDSSRRDYSSRDIFEFALVHHAIDHDRHLMGVCRGAQVINVACGGSLKNTDKGDGYQKISTQVEKVTDVMRAFFGPLLGKKPHVGYSCHGQAVDKPGQGIEVIQVFQDCVKSIMHVSGRVFGVQYHPEEAHAVSNDSDVMITYLMVRQLMGSQNSMRQLTDRIESISDRRARVRVWRELYEMMQVATFDIDENISIYRRFIDLCSRGRLRVQEVNP